MTEVVPEPASCLYQATASTFRTVRFTPFRSCLHNAVLCKHVRSLAAVAARRRQHKLTASRARGHDDAPIPHRDGPAQLSAAAAASGLAIQIRQLVWRKRLAHAAALPCAHRIDIAVHSLSKSECVSRYFCSRCSPAVVGGWRGGSCWQHESRQDTTCEIRTRSLLLAQRMRALRNHLHGKVALSRAQCMVGVCGWWCLRS